MTKAFVLRARADGAVRSVAQRSKLNDELREFKKGWARAGSSHNSKSAAACDYAAMPRELLPRLCYVKALSDSSYPQISQSTVDAVRAMRHVRSCAKRTVKEFKHGWPLLQARLKEYASTGSGSLAEAIVHNDCCWRGKVAHATPSESRRRKTTRYDDSSDSSDSDGDAA
jgi:hypothetical protein